MSTQELTTWFRIRKLWISLTCGLQWTISFPPGELGSSHYNHCVLTYTLHQPAANSFFYTWNQPRTWNSSQVCPSDSCTSTTCQDNTLSKAPCCYVQHTTTLLSRYPSWSPEVACMDCTICSCAGEDDWRSTLEQDFGRLVNSWAHSGISWRKGVLHSWVQQISCD